MKNETILSSSERVCEECGRKFVIPSVDLWAYKLSIKGRTKFFCRYNCVRAGERKLKDVATRGTKDMNKNKPTKDVLEADLRSGLSGPAIAKKYNCSNPTVHKWIKDYELQDIQAVRKPKGEPVITNTPPVIVSMVQESPTLSEIEQFHTDEPAQELPKVEMEPDLYRCADCGETFSSIVAHMTLCKLCSETLANDRVNEEMATGPQGMTEEENMTDAEWEAEGISFVDVTPDPKPAPAPDPRLDAILRGSCKEVIQGVKQDLESVRRVLELQAKDFYQEILRQMFAELMGESGLKGTGD